MNLTTPIRQLRSGRAVGVFRSLAETLEGVEILSDEERKRGEAFIHPISQKAFFMGRVLLRQVLREFVDEVILEIGPHGKPRCRSSDAPAFNLSHTTDGILAVFSPHGPVGADMEPLNRQPKNPDRLAQKVFTDKERQRLAAGERDFLSLWTRKESVLKAMGTGFAGGAGTLETDEHVLRSGWRIEEFRLGNMQGAVCLPRSVTLVLPKVLS